MVMVVKLIAVVVIAAALGLIGIFWIPERIASMREPSTLVLVGIGFVGLLGFAMRRSNSKLYIERRRT